MKKLLFAFPLLVSCAHAAPTISSVTGTITHGQSLVVAGTGYGTKSPAKPLVWATFDSNVNPTSQGTATGWNEVKNMAWDSDEGYNSGGGAKGTAGNGVWALRIDSNSPSWNATSQKSYLFRREKKNFIPIVSADGDNNFKSWRVWPAGASGYSNGTIGEHNGRPYVEGLGGSLEPAYWANARTNTTNWVQKELILKASSANSVKDGSLEERFDGVRKHSGTLITKSAAAPAAWVAHFVVHGVAANLSRWENPAWSQSNNFWADDVYVDTTWQRVMVGDASTFANCRKFGFIVPTAWSDTSITGTLQIHANLFPAGSTAYVYVLDSSNVPNTAGKAITIGGTVEGDPAPTITSVNVSTGSYLGGTVSTATCTGLTATPTVLIGTVSATSVVMNSATSIRFTIPANTPSLTGLDLRITNPDGQFAVLQATMSYDAPAANQPPYNVSAGDNWAVTLPSDTQLSGAAEDDGLPGAMTYQWAKASGAGTVTFVDSTALVTRASFSASGTYTLTLTANDGALSTVSPEVTVVVSPVVTVVSPGGAFPWKNP